MLHTCEFCSTQFEPRPQIKNPKACNKETCQRARQRQNENDWHQKHKDFYIKNAKYHKEQRIERYRLIMQIINDLLDAMFSGFRFKKIQVNCELFKTLFHNFMCRIGIRKINKFYSAEKLFINQQIRTWE